MQHTYLNYDCPFSVSLSPALGPRPLRIGQEVEQLCLTFHWNVTDNHHKERVNVTGLFCYFPDACVNVSKQKSEIHIVCDLVVHKHVFFFHSHQQKSKRNNQKQTKPKKAVQKKEYTQ